MKIKEATKPQEQAGTELMTVPEAAELFKVQVSTIRAWVLHKKVPYVKVFGKLIRFRRADLEKIIAGRVVPAETA